MPTFEVPIIYSGQCNFVVKADNDVDARIKAELLFNDGKRPDELGNEWEKIDRVCKPKILQKT